MKIFFKNACYSLAGLLLIIFWSACNKDVETEIPPEIATFAGQSGGTFEITMANATFNVPVGFTTVAGTDRQINVSVSSPTGAVEGTHYTIPNKTVTVPAGQATASLQVNGVLAQYQSGRKDTLIFTINGGNDAAASGFSDTYTLALRGPCFEGDVDLNVLLGTYANTVEDFGGSAYGPYTTTISAVNSTSPTSGTVTVTNLWDFGWNPIVFMLDWSDPANRTVTLTQQAGIADAGTLSGTYSGMDVSVRPHGSRMGTFSVCSQTLILELQLGVTGLGFFPQTYTVNMAR
ncbi:MAG: hypothetical protein H0V30_00145 [Chitinophagaceae bacterium]|nr:hypothetical protein [Chitinophagaceae bacterium]